MKIEKSEFEKLCQEDMNLFRDIAERFQKVSVMDRLELEELQKDTWLLATRWSEIQSNARKISQQYGINKTDFGNWAHQKYRQLQELHITCRSWYRQAWEDERALQMTKNIL